MAVGFNIQIGAAGALVTLPSPSFGYAMPLTRPRTTRTVLSGGVRVQQAAVAARQWVYTWGRPLAAADYDTIRQIYEAEIGTLPYELHDPTLGAVVPLVAPIGDLGASSSAVLSVTQVTLTLQEVLS
jgi:hypothetical protein